MTPHLQVMKFGGTSVGDASCILRVAEIVAKASHASPLIVVVSAMSGVTNRLIEAATCSETGDRDRAAELLEALRQQHFEALKILIQNPETRDSTAQRIEELLSEAQRLCEGTALSTSSPPARSIAFPALANAFPRRSSPAPSENVACAAKPSKPPN